MHERMSLRRRWPVAVTIAVLAVAIGAVLGSVHVGSAAIKSPPKNTTPPSLSGTPQVGSTLKASNGEWDQAGGGPISSYKYHWLRCDENGGSCSTISGADGSSYNLRNVDAGNTLRVRVTATNGDGSTSATSVPSSVIKKAAPTTTAAPTPKQTGRRGFVCQLQDDRVPVDQRRRELPDRDGDREVPGGDQPDHPQRTTKRRHLGSGGRLLEMLADGAVGLAREEAEDLRGTCRLPARFANRLAHLQRHVVGDVVYPCLEVGGGAQKEGGARRERQP